MMLTQQSIQRFIRLALEEDGAFRDLTSRTILPASAQIQARIIAKSPGILAGGRIVAAVFRAVRPAVSCRLAAREGGALRAGQAIADVRGSARAIFAAERTALNLLGHLCGIATLTRAYVKQTRGTRAKIYDTRKTLPGLRTLEKYAVKVGGGENHRMGLHDAVLIKTNHLKALSRQQPTTTSIRAGIERARRRAGKKFLEVEVTSLPEFQAALDARPGAILLDNWSLGQIKKAVDHRQGCRPLLEVSGGVTLNNVGPIARTGVDRISIGRLTHSAPWLDVALEVCG